MSSSFDEYYYDEETGEEVTKNKLDIACESIVSLLEHLNNDDRFGMVLFDGYGYIGKPMSLVGKTDMEAIKNHILELIPRGSTNFEAGYQLGTKLFNDIPDLEMEEYENRIIFLTDAMPNVGELNEESLLGMTEKNAENKIYSTFIGIGVDFNTDLIEYITKTKGANYYSVHSSEEFKIRMDDEFEYMVTPLVFDLQLNFESSGYEIEKVYGSPEADEATGEIMKVNTLFPSKTSDEGVKVGIILLKLKKISDDNSLTLSTNYEDRNGIVDGDTVSLILENEETNVYPNTGIRKGILLTRYVNVLKNWLVNEAEMDSEDLDDIIPMIDSNTGIFLADEDKCIQILSKWEQESKPLKVSQEYKELFLEFIPYFEGEMNAIGDNTLIQEIEILKKLSTYEENNS
jgi:Ca-activated chloride channel family protein